MFLNHVGIIPVGTIRFVISKTIKLKITLIKNMLTCIQGDFLRGLTPILSFNNEFT